MIVDVGVTNPLRGVNTVAVVPFFNQSSEQAVDGRHLANLYATELQKIPGVEVIPVGVAERALQQFGLQNMSSPQEAARLATLLNADAVVIGSVTEYSPYQPPRLGLSIAWYSPRYVQFDPGVPVDPGKTHRIHKDLQQRRKAEFNFHKDRIIHEIERRLDDFFLFAPASSGEILPGAACCKDAPVTGDSTRHAQPHSTPQPSPHSTPHPFPSLPPAPPSTAPLHAPKHSPSREPSSAEDKSAEDKPLGNETSSADGNGPTSGRQQPGDSGRSWQSRFRPPIVIRGQNAGGLNPHGSTTATTPSRRSTTPPLRPLMTYTKIVDAADSGTAAAFRDYLELRGDARRGSWEARLLWADEFPRFAMHVMIVEMFQLHGGQARRRMILKWRKHK